MIYTPLTIKAMKIAYKAHEGQFDKTGVPYIFHPVHVAELMDNEKRTCMALLHDVAEDTEVTLEDLAKEFPSEIIESLKLLTHTDDVTYWEYLDGIVKNPDALIVKIGDLLHNTDRTRRCLGNVSEEKIKEWDKKYIKAVKLVREAACQLKDSPYETEYELGQKLLSQFKPPFNN